MAGCKINGCERAAKSNDLCSKHYRNFKRCGDPLGLQHRSERAFARSVHPLYAIWNGMQHRCFNPRNKSFPNYGGRGITVCERWRVFENFVADMPPRPSLRHSIDRIDPNGNYEPGNVQWATPDRQSWNRRVSRLTTADRERIMQLMTQDRTKLSIAAELGLDYTALLSFTTGKTYQPDDRDHSGEAPVVLQSRRHAPVEHVACSQPDCDREVYSGTLCHKHWKWVNVSKTLADVANPLADRFCAQCNVKITEIRRVTAKFCSVACKMRFHRASGCYAAENRPADERKCSVEGCDRQHQAHGMCRTHYMRQWHAANDRKKDVTDG